MGRRLILYPDNHCRQPSYTRLVIARECFPKSGKRGNSTLESAYPLAYILSLYLLQFQQKGLNPTLPLMRWIVQSIPHSIPLEFFLFKGISKSEIQCQLQSSKVGCMAQRRHFLFRSSKASISPKNFIGEPPRSCWIGLTNLSPRNTTNTDPALKLDCTPYV